LEIQTGEETMPSKIRDSIPARRSVVLATGLAAALLSAAIPAQAQNGDPLRVDRSKQTFMTVRIVGLDYPEVRREVRKTAQLVCHNAMRKGELPAFDLRWCAQQASSAALDYYRSATAAGEIRAGSLTVGVAEGN
jgi:hypothetical protein